MVYAKIFSILPLFFIELAAIVSLISFRENFPRSMKMLSLVWLFVFAVEIIGHITGLMGIRNFWIYDIFDIIFLFSLAVIYRMVINTKVIKLLVGIFCVVFPLLAIANIVFIQKLQEYNSLNYLFGGAFMILLVGTYFWQLYASVETTN